MDIGQNFSFSYNALLRNKVLVLPNFAGALITVVIISIFLFASGFYGVAVQYFDLVQKYNQEHPKAFGQVNDKELSKYLEAHEFGTERLMGLLNVKNVVLMIVFGLAIIVFSYYLRCAVYVMTAIVVKNKKLSISQITKSSNKIFFRLLFYYLLILLLILIPILLLIFGIVILFSISKVLGILSAIIVVLIIIAYMIFMAIKLLFSLPIMIVEDQNAYNSIKQSYTSTKKRLKEAFLVFIITIGMSIALAIVSSIFPNRILYIFKFTNILKFLFNFIFMMLFFLVSATVDAFIHLFLFYSYVDFKKS